MSKELQIESLIGETEINTLETKPSTDITVTGILSFADSKKRKIKLTDKKNIDYEIEVPQGLLSDIVKPYFEEAVIIKGFWKGKKIQLKDIEKAE